MVFQELEGRARQKDALDNLPVFPIMIGALLSEIGAFMIWGFGGVVLTTGVFMLVGSAASVAVRHLIEAKKHNF